MLHKVFMAGPIKGNEKNNQKTHEFRFNALTKLINQINVFSVFNPCWLKVDQSAWSTEDLVTIDMAAMHVADIVLFLPGWELNDGSKFENDYVTRTKKPHVYLSEEELLLPVDELRVCIKEKLLNGLEPQ